MTEENIENCNSCDTAEKLAELPVINNMQTAYDVDKVVEQLERASIEEPLTADGVKVGTIKVLILKHAVEIVKGGGVDDK